MKSKGNVFINAEDLYQGKTAKIIYNGSLSKTSNETIYFKKNETDYQVSIAGSTTYYLAIWLTDIGEEQSADYSKDFSGYIGFESTEFSGLENGKIEANFAA